jgi:hypothetical protein
MDLFGGVVGHYCVAVFAEYFGVRWLFAVVVGFVVDGRRVV